MWWYIFASRINVLAPGVVSERRENGVVAQEAIGLSIVLWGLERTRALSRPENWSS
jgi:hypothetical protein